MKAEEDQKPIVNGYQYRHFDGIAWAVFNCLPHERRKGRKAVVDKFGIEGWRKVKAKMKTGIMELFRHAPEPETELYTFTIGEAADKRVRRKNLNRPDA